MAWNVVGIRDADTSPDRDTAAAALVTIAREGEERRMLVELTGSAAARHGNRGRGRARPCRERESRLLNSAKSTS
jgi:hypothetical protein